MKKVLILVVILAIGGVLGVVGYQRYLQRERDDANGALRLFGNVDIRDAALSFHDPERLATVQVEEGDRVTAGQVVATQQSVRIEAELVAARARVTAQAAVVERFERGTRPQELAQAGARVHAAEVQVQNAQRVVERVRRTAATGAASEQSRDDAEAGLAIAEAALQVERESLALAEEGPRAEDVAQARATLESMRAEVGRLEVSLRDTELRAPSPGVVRSRVLEPGEMAGPDRAVVIVALTDPKWIRVWVPEPELGRVAPGLEVVVRSDSFGGREYPGRIGFVSPVAEFTPQHVETQELRTQLVYEVRVVVEDPDDELRLGMPVTVDVASARAK
ncbi:MAG: efflux RND transporter periplasmic adaptor subunit [Planctomycetes bacterium]|nr:efflux RND transporter periplasmic adaptor subunit [Planctomycetota bacterium]